MCIQNISKKLALIFKQQCSVGMSQQLYVYDISICNYLDTHVQLYISQLAVVHDTCAR